MIGEGQLAWMREMSAAALNRTCTIPGDETTVTNAGDGTWSESASAGATDVRCSFVAAAGNERVVGGAIAQVGNYVMWFEHGTTLTANMTIAVDALEVDGVEVERARTFQLVAPLDESVPVGLRWLATEG